MRAALVSYVYRLEHGGNLPEVLPAHNVSATRAWLRPRHELLLDTAEGRTSLLLMPPQSAGRSVGCR
jgi:hypothetical protein